MHTSWISQCSEGGQSLEWVTLFKESERTRGEGDLKIELGGPSILNGREISRDEWPEMKKGENRRREVQGRHSGQWCHSCREIQKVPFEPGGSSLVILVIHL